MLRIILSFVLLALPLAVAAHPGHPDPHTELLSSILHAILSMDYMLLLVVILLAVYAYRFNR